jgi:hypothetical protein
VGCTSEVERLLWVVEVFFTLSGCAYHEVAFVYGFVPSDPSVLERAWPRNITDGSVRIEFRWFPLDDLEVVNLQPGFLKYVLKNPPATTTHLIIRG